jgi:organic radical activating enzyme
VVGAAAAVDLDAAAIVARLLALDVHGSRMVVVTGGEPTLQWDAELADAVRAAGFRVHMESNGTRAPGAPVDWLTISPKPQHHPAGLPLADSVQPDELKVVVDDTVNEAVLDVFAARYRCEHYFLQPWMMDGAYERNLSRTIALIHARPRWRLSVQMHKVIGVP